MRRFLVTIVGLAILVGGGVYFAAETYVLPKQEKVWRELLADLPEGYQADFEDISFQFIGLRLSISNVTLSSSDGSSVRIDEVVAENSPKTALRNLINVLLEREEENYDLVRFKTITPSVPQPGLEVSIAEVRIHNVKIGIDNELPTTIKSLTGAVGLDQALQASSADGFEVLGVAVNFQGIEGKLGALSLLEISDANLGLFEIRDVSVSQGGQAMMKLDLARTVNLNISPYMEPMAMIQAMNGGPVPDVTVYNPFHSADEMRMEGLLLTMPGMATLSLKQAYYIEDETQVLDKVGIVPTKTSSGMEDYFIDFGGLAPLSPELGQFIAITEISSVNMDAESNSEWNLATSEYSTGGWTELENLIKISAGLQLGKFAPQDLYGAISQGMALVQSFPTKDLSAETLKAFAQVPVSPDVTYGAIELQKIHLILENQSLIERLFKFGAAMMGTTPEDLKAMLDQQIVMIEQDPTLPPSLVDDLEAVRAFIAEPGMLALSIEPPTPVSFDEMASTEDPNVLVERLGIKITANGVH